MQRHRVLWIGDAPSADFQARFAERGMELFITPFPEFAPHVPSARAAIFWMLSDDEFQVLANGPFARLLTHGLLTIVMAEFESVVRWTIRMREHRWAHRRVHLLPRHMQPDLPEKCARYSIGPQQSDRVIINGAEECREEDLVLLHRAFSDCVEVDLRKLTTGTALVFQAFARLEQSKIGPYPLPLFVKLDKQHKIERELSNYRDCTGHFVPFFARPNLDLDRCLLGARRGLIVGNFVEHSDSLAELVRRGTAGSAINSLFENALRGWRSQAYLRADAVMETSLAPDGAIRTWRQPAQDRAAEYSSQASKHGATIAATEVGALLDGLPAIRHRRGTCHGDLHGENVRVRSSEAILIDFAAVVDAPLVMDPAVLETSLVLKYMRASSHRWTEDDWVKLAEDLYSIESLSKLPDVRAPTARMNELWNVVRQIRRFGFADQLSEFEYARAVAIQLLRHAMRPRDKDESLVRRPTFIRLAGLVASELVQHAAQAAALKSGLS